MYLQAPQQRETVVVGFDSQLHYRWNQGETRGTQKTDKKELYSTLGPKRPRDLAFKKDSMVAHQVDGPDGGR